MTDGRLSNVADKPLSIDSSVIDALREFRDKEKLLYLPGVNVEMARARLSALVNTLTDELIRGVSQSPSKRWVLTCFQHQLEKLQQEGTEATEHFGLALLHRSSA
jgi:hypothetical protein